MVPNLRFPYKGDWQKRKLNEICLFFKGNGLSKSDLSNEGFRCILYGELYTTYKNEIISDIISKTNTTLSNPCLSRKNDLIIPGSGEDPIDIAVARAIYQNDIILGGDLNVLRPKSNVSAAFLSYQLNGVRRYDIAKKAQGKSIVHLHNSDLKEIYVSIPTYDEQLHIVKLLTKIDEMIETQIKIIRVLESQKKELSNILFNKYCKDSSYYPLEDIVSSESIKDFQIQTKDYLPNGKFEVVDQGKKEIIGYSDNSNKLYTKVPVIVYGDHTTIIKYREIPFIVGGDGVKLLKAKTGFLQKYIYYAVCQFNISSEGYKRHWNMLKNVLIPIPNYETQKIIIDTLDSFTNKIKNEEALLEKYRLQKQFLLNNLFI